MKYFTRTYYSACYANKCTRPDYIFSPFGASLVVGSIFSIVIKEYISKELLYVKRQNEEIIGRLKNLQRENQNNIGK